MTGSGIVGNSAVTCSGGSSRVTANQQARAVKDRKGSLVIRRPSGVELQRIRFDRTDGGFVSRDIVMPKTAPRGNWHASLEMDGITDPVGVCSVGMQ